MIAAAEGWTGTLLDGWEKTCWKELDVKIRCERYEGILPRTTANAGGNIDGVLSPSINAVAPLPSLDVGIFGKGFSRASNSMTEFPWSTTVVGNLIWLGQRFIE